MALDLPVGVRFHGAHFAILQRIDTIRSMSAPQLKLTYFDFGGRAELTRLALVYGGVAFEDNRIDGPTFGQLKPTLPLGQMPVLEVNGVVYPQSMALARYAARLAGLQPEDALESLKVDMLVETLLDGLNTYVDVNWRTPDEAAKAEKIKKFTEEGLPKIFGLLEKNVAGKFFLGDKASLADLFVFDLYQNAFKVTFPDFTVSAFPKVEAIMATVAANENVAAYLAKHA